MSRYITRVQLKNGVTSLQTVITAAYTAASRTGKQYSLTVMKDKRVPA